MVLGSIASAVERGQPKHWELSMKALEMLSRFFPPPLVQEPHQTDMSHMRPANHIHAHT